MNFINARARGRGFGETEMPVRDTDDRDYFARRAHEERQMAATCEDNAAAMAHLKMADEYSKRAGEVPVETRTTVT